VVDEHRNVRPLARVLDAAQGARPLRLRVDRAIHGVPREGEDDWYEVRPAVRIDRRQPRDPRRGYALSKYLLVVHLGLILPNFGEAASPERIRRTAVAAEELGFDSVWATEHILVGAQAVDPYGRVFAPLVTLGWIAAFTERVALGTSIVVAPLHHPVHLAKEAATLQELSGGRLKLGLGMGWHEDEFQNLGAEFHGRGRRAEEGIRLMRALWRGERSFAGRHRSFENATFAPLPEPEPELWFGGSSDRAVRRALEHGGVWHPSRGGDPGRVRTVKKEHPELPTIPRARLENVDAVLEVGAEGVVVALPDEAGMRDFVRRYRG
jgi:probable F420-dependent oxidoreductase